MKLSTFPLRTAMLWALQVGRLLPECTLFVPISLRTQSKQPAETSFTISRLLWYSVMLFLLDGKIDITDFTICHFWVSQLGGIKGVYDALKRSPQSMQNLSYPWLKLHIHQTVTPSPFLWSYLYCLFIHPKYLVEVKSHHLFLWPAYLFRLLLRCM